MDLAIGHTEYEHDLHSNLWLQKQYTTSLLQRFCKANSIALKSISLSRAHTLNREIVPAKASLYSLAEIGSLDFPLSWEVFNRVLQELAFPGRPPVLFILDGLDYISRLTNYHDTEHNLIHAHDFALPRLFLDYLTGKRSFWRGLTITATTSHAPSTPALNWALSGETPPPYSKTDIRIAPSIAGVPIMKISSMTREQTRSLMEYYKNSGVYTQDVDETLPEKWVLSSGIPKELLRTCMRVKY